MVAHLGRAHFGLEIVGRHLGRWRHVAIFALLRLFLAAIQEEGDVRVFLGFGEAELAQALLRHPGAEGVDDIAGRENRGHVGIVAGRILDHAKPHQEPRVLTISKLGKAGLANGAQDLAGAVGAEIEEENAVIVVNTGVASHHGGLDELVGFAALIGVGDRGVGIGRGLAHCLDHRIVGLRHALPTIVAVHREVSARNADHLGAFGQIGLEPGNLLAGRLRRHIAPVGNDMHGDRHPGSGNHPGGGDDVILVGMDAARRGQAHQVRGAAGGFHAVDEVEQRRLLLELAVFDREGDHAEIHRHHPARADIGVANFGIAHLPVRQTDRAAMGGERGMRARGDQPVEIRGIGQFHGVVLARFANAETVENAQADRFGNGHREPRFLLASTYAGQAAGAMRAGEHDPTRPGKICRPARQKPVSLLRARR